MGSKHSKTGQYKGPKNPRQQADELRRKINLLKVLPSNFRDIVPGSKGWKIFRELIPRIRQEMETWSSGRILVFQPLNKLEVKALGNRAMIIYPEDTTFNWQLFKELIDHAEKNAVSFIYLQEQEAKAIDDLNRWLSRWGCNCRIMRAFVDDHGRTIGDVY